MVQNISHTKALRAIGQDLEARGIMTFRLKRSDDRYMVRGAESHSRLKRFLRLERFRIQEMNYSADEIERMDESGQAKRGSGKALDLLTLSQVLRAVGTLIDLREGRLVELHRLAEPGADPSLGFRYESHEGRHVQQKYSHDDLRAFCEHMHRWRKSTP